MANIIPFNGLRYNSQKVNFSDVVSLPYDKLDKDMLTALMQKSPYNIAQQIQGDFLREDSGDEWYDQVKETISNWIADEILITSESPCLYIYEQIHTLDGNKLSRIGFSALGELQPFSLGHIKPHENTFSGPKIDRTKLLKATRINFGQIFMLFYGQENNIRDLIIQKTQDINPLCDFVDDSGIQHRFWEISEPSFVDNIVTQMKGQDLLIADGHHRYETALEYYEYMKSQDPDNADKYRYRLMTFVDINDPSLVILPTHRVFLSKEELSSEFWNTVLTKLSADFTISDPLTDISLNNLQNILDSTSEDRPFFLMAKGSEVRQLQIKETSFQAIDSETHKLSVSVLQDFIARNILGKDITSMAPGKDVDYYKNLEGVLSSVKENGHSLGFLMKPTPIHQVKKVVKNGGRMPQKSTDFFPKIYTGFVFNKM